MASVMELIESRRSVRSFDGRELEPEDLAALKEFMGRLRNPFDVAVEFRLLDAEEHGLKSPVIVGERTFVAAKVRRAKNCDAACGYEFERLCLFAASLGVGTVMMASTMNRGVFEEVLQLAENEYMPLVSPVGYPAAHMSLRERAMRLSIGADDRLPFDQLFFEGSFERPLAPERAGELAQPLEAIRLAPSAANKQPWRVVVMGDELHLYLHRSINGTMNGDVQVADMGIAQAHFDLVAGEQGMKVHLKWSNPGIPVPDDTEYIGTIQIV